MNWSTNKPKKPGWYWWRPLSTDAPTLVEVTLEEDGVLKVGPPAILVEGGNLGHASGEWGRRVVMA
jgi:hypothetical protein